MKKSLKILLTTAGVFTSVTSIAGNPNAATDFHAEYLMNAALDVGQDVNAEQLNLSRNAGVKKAQEYLHGITADIRTMMRNVEKHADSGNEISSDNLGAWVDSWGKAERINVRVSARDTEATNRQNDIDKNTSFNLVIKFAKEHHVHHLDDITFRFVPQISESQDGEFSIQGWYCETDIDWVDFTKEWQEPAEDGSTANVQEGVKAHRSMVTRDLLYPFSSCVIAKTDIELPATAEGLAEEGIAATDIVTH